MCPAFVCVIVPSLWLKLALLFWNDQALNVPLRVNIALPVSSGASNVPFAEIVILSTDTTDELQTNPPAAAIVTSPVTVSVCDEPPSNTVSKVPDVITRSPSIIVVAAMPIVLLAVVPFAKFNVKSLRFPVPVASNSKSSCCAPVFVIIRFKSPPIVPSLSNGLFDDALSTVTVLSLPSNFPNILNEPHAASAPSVIKWLACITKWWPAKLEASDPPPSAWVFQLAGVWNANALPSDVCPLE